MILRWSVITLLCIGYAVLFLRFMHRSVFPAWASASVAWLIVLAAAYCLESCGVPLRHRATPARCWDIRRWPETNRRHFFCLTMIGFLITTMLAVVGFIMGK